MTRPVPVAECDLNVFVLEALLLLYPLHAQFLPQSLFVFFPVPVRQEARVHIRVLAEFALDRRLAVLLVCFLVLVVCCFFLLALVLQFEGEGGDLSPLPLLLFPLLLNLALPLKFPFLLPLCQLPLPLLHHVFLFRLHLRQGNEANSARLELLLDGVVVGGKLVLHGGELELVLNALFPQLQLLERLFALLLEVHGPAGLAGRPFVHRHLGPESVLLKMSPDGRRLHQASSAFVVIPGTVSSFGVKGNLEYPKCR
uniref:Uncharacterized protein n=1 Tax=Ixodes ricinus TaxID=34613 RepID=A0A147BEC9_IXORI